MSCQVVPFLVTAIFLIYFMIRGTVVDESEGVKGQLRTELSRRRDPHPRPPQGAVQRPPWAGSRRCWRLECFAWYLCSSRGSGLGS